MEWMLAQRLFANTNTNTNTSGKNTGDCARDLYEVNVCATAVQKSKHLSNKIATAPRSSSACNCGFIKRAQFNQTSSMAPSRPIYPPQPTAHMWPSLYYAQTCSFMLVYIYEYYYCYFILVGQSLCHALTCIRLLKIVLLLIFISGAGWL